MLRPFHETFTREELFNFSYFITSVIVDTFCFIFYYAYIFIYIIITFQDHLVQILFQRPKIRCTLQLS